MVTLAVLLALALGTTMAFAQPADASRGIAIREGANPSMNVALWYVPERGSSAARASRGIAIREGANPGMNVALWYAPERGSSAASAIREGANPSMNVALWYGTAWVSQTATASRLIDEGADLGTVIRNSESSLLAANPELMVARRYPGVLVGLANTIAANPELMVARRYSDPGLRFALEPNSGAVSASRAIREGANPSMDVALWYITGPQEELFLCAAGELLPCP
jgi:hypothetical protein